MDIVKAVEQTDLQSAPLIEFHLFPRLPEELRRNIWKFACSYERLFHLELPSFRTIRDIPTGSITLPPGNGIPFLHTEIGISLNSRYPAPILFFVAREAASEAKATYKLIECVAVEDRHGGDLVDNSLARQETQRRVSRYRMWFNPESDVIYLGHKTCLGVLISLLKLGLPIQRIAFDAEGGNYAYHSCCDAAIAKKTCLQPFLGHQVNWIERRLRILHGFTIAGSTENVFPGCPSLKEVLLFMKTPGPFDPEIGWPVNNSNPLDCFFFERYTTDRPHYPLVGQIRMSMGAYIDCLLATTISSFPESDSAWKGGKKTPRFQLARFSRSLPVGHVFKPMVVNFSSVGQHRMVWWKACQRSDGAITTTFPATYSGPGSYVFKLMGSKASVTLQMKDLMEEIRKAEALYKQEINIVEPKMAIFPAKLGIIL